MSTKKQLEVAAVQSIAEGWTSGTRRDLSRDEANTEIQDVTRSSDVLAEAAAVLLVPWTERKPDTAAVELLVAAGADRMAIQRHADVRRARPTGFDLGGMADRGQRPAS